MTRMMRWIGIGVVALMCVPVLSGCQIAQVAAQNAKPASPPQLYDNPPSSAWWPDEQKYYVGSPSFAMRIQYSLFNRIGVTLGGVAAEELPRGTAGGRGPDRRALAPGKVYYQLASISSDANAQIAVDWLFVVDLANVLPDPGSVSGALTPQNATEVPLVVTETSINPQYQGTTDEKKATTTTVVYGRDLVGPIGAYAPQCDFAIGGLPDPNAIFGGALRVGDSLNFYEAFPSGNCKQVTSFVKDQIDFPRYRQIARKTMANPAATPGRIAGASIVIPQEDNSSWVTVRVEGLDWLKRPTLREDRVFVEFSRQRPANPCAAGNGTNGQKQNFGYCGRCEDAPAASHFAAYCTRDEGGQVFEDYLASVGGRSCNVTDGLCPACPADNGFGGSAFNFDYCVTCNAQRTSFTLQGICDKDKGQEYLETTQRQNNGAACTVTQGSCP